MTDQRITELEAQNAQLSARNASTADELRRSRDSEKALRAEITNLESQIESIKRVVGHVHGAMIEVVEVMNAVR